MPFFQRGRPRVFAHRGGSALAPENTLAAFEQGLRAGADGLELDVRLSADGVPVVVHDPTLDRTTNATGPVAARTAAELARVDAGWRFAGPHGDFPFRGQGLGIPALREVLLRHRDVPIIIEMKIDSEAMATRVAGDIVAAGAEGNVCAAGYGGTSAAAIRRALPQVAASATHAEVRLAVYRSWGGWPVRRPPFGGYQVPEYAGRIRIVSPRFIRHAHAAGLEVQVWTIDAEDDMERLLGWGADALISNRPDLAVTMRDAFAGAL
ncbi:MAG TPA: glycerophosphodiester phosphodiesterase, partial [Gemmatimonadaceae bacterium]|nr:glycerophosphodiester phosphodiesterase [Gemmatimonadaceae bacterium]